MTARAVTDDRVEVRLLRRDWDAVLFLLREEEGRAEERVAGMVSRDADDEEFSAALDGIHELRAIRAAILWSLRREGVTA